MFPSRKRIKSGIGRAAGATLGYIGGNLPGAVAGYNAGAYLADDQGKFFPLK